MMIRSLLLRSIFAVLVLGLTACSSTPVELEPKELEDIQQTARLEKLWSASIGSGQDIRYTLLTPAVAGDVIYATDIKGNVFALDRMTGKRIWRTELDEPVSAGVGQGNGLVLVGTYDAEVIALDAESGAERWRSKVASEVLASPQTNGDVVVVQAFNGRLTALDHETGQQRWVYDASMPLLTLRGNATPLIVGTTVYAGFANGKVVALEADDGLLVWEQRIAIPQGRSELERMVDVDASPLLVGNILFVVSYQGELVALSRATGRPLWTQPASSFNDLGAGQGKVYMTAADSSVAAYDATSGQLSWKNEQLLRRKLTAPTAFDDYVAVGDEIGGFLHLLNPGNGEIVARRRVDRAGLRSPMVAVDDVLYVYSNDGSLVAFRVKPLDAE
ncbi:outer membrane protein assembly factor BamB [Proteobacteria bacterium 005FR1]|nr:outer membrane protein assembly factor BamB [Proteobacteria bacterium 005FR1]